MQDEYLGVSTWKWRDGKYDSAEKKNKIGVTPQPIIEYLGINN